MSEQDLHQSSHKGGLNCPHCGAKSISIGNKLLRWKYQCRACGGESRLSFWMVGLIIGLGVLGAALTMAGESLGMISSLPDDLIPLGLVLFIVYVLLYAFFVPLRRIS